jgi:hypothetical protein
MPLLRSSDGGHFNQIVVGLGVENGSMKQTRLAQSSVRMLLRGNYTLREKKSKSQPLWKIAANRCQLDEGALAEFLDQ